MDGIYFRSWASGISTGDYVFVANRYRRVVSSAPSGDGMVIGLSGRPGAYYEDMSMVSAFTPYAGYDRVQLPESFPA